MPATIVSILLNNRCKHLLLVLNSAFTICSPHMTSRFYAHGVCKALCEECTIIFYKKKKLKGNRSKLRDFRISWVWSFIPCVPWKALNLCEVIECFNVTHELHKSIREATCPLDLLTFYDWNMKLHQELILITLSVNDCMHQGVYKWTLAHIIRNNKEKVLLNMYMKVNICVSICWCVYL